MIFFDTIVKRVTNFSVQSYDKNREHKIHFFKNNLMFQLSILASSRSLYEDVGKNKINKIENSLSKYFIRAHFNPTPFGVFNSVGVMKWGDSTLIRKDKGLTVSTKYDNLFLSKQIRKDFPDNWLNSYYCLNPTIHFLNKSKISFYKSDIESTEKIGEKYVEIDYDEDLGWLMSKFERREKLSVILEEIVSDGFERIDVEVYLKNVIECGLIIEYFIFFPYAEKLEKVNPNIFSNLIEKKWHRLKDSHEIDSFIKEYLKEQNTFFKIENSSEKYSHAINTFDKEEGHLDLVFQEKIKRFIDFTIHYNSHSSHKNDVLNKFIGKISEFYNDGFIPINKVFNPYSGLNYTSLKTSYDLKLDNAILHKILAGSTEDIYLDLPFNSNLEIKREKMPASFTILAEVLMCKKSKNKILYIKSLGMNSALNIISRFTDITNKVSQEIVDYEKEMNKDKILADINCIGGFRGVNISARKQFYDFTIPINSSFKNNSNPILLSDIFIHLHGGKISLVSQKHRKQVLPKITTAINPNLSDSELYKFLCDFECYNQEIYGVSFDFNSYTYYKPYIPRIYLEKDILLSPAQILLVDNDFTLEEFVSYMSDTFNFYNFSRLINLSEKKGQLVLDTEDKNDQILIYKRLKDKKKFYVSESLYDSFDPQIVNEENENFPHELVLSIKNTEYKRNNYFYDNIEEISNKEDNMPLISDWLYLEIFSNSYSTKDILKHVSEIISSLENIDSFFFVNYYNPDKCLRLRFKTTCKKDKEYVISKIHELKNASIIIKYHILPYDQEIHRYGGIKLMQLAEYIFKLDSYNVLENMINVEIEDDAIKSMAILKIKNYLEIFNYSLDEMISHCENSINMFEKEFNLTSDLRKSFNKEYQDIKFKIEDLEDNNFLDDEVIKKSIEKAFLEEKYTKYNYVPSIIHMSMNRHFDDNHRFNEFKSYYLTKLYLNQIKFKKNK
jgi:thiopeptide-type bacteriocin biosynthesis protein